MTEAPLLPATSGGGALGSTLRAVRRKLGSAPALAPALAELDRLIGSSGPRLRVALVGRVSAGKSTLANALLGGYRAPVGVQELTYNVTWISHGETPTLTVHYTDGRPPAIRDVGDLEQLTVRDESGDESRVRELDAIDHLHITDPAPYLRSFDLVDTPGLDSVFGSDSANTLRFLDGPVDAMVLVVSRAMAAGEPELLAGFQGNGMTPSPINAVTALTKVERMWSWPDEPDPMTVGRQVAEQMMAVPAVRRVTHGVHPVASLVAAGAAALDAADLADLTELAVLPEDTLARRLRRADAFVTRESADVPLPSHRRARLIGTLAGYGVLLAARIVREGVTDLPGLRAELDERSGMAAFRRLLVDHFGNRAELITLNRVHGRVQALPDAVGRALDPRERLTLTEAVREFTRYSLGENPRFRELDTLRAYYAGSLDISARDGAELLRITGEHGPRPHARLGMPALSRPDALAAAARARLRYWRELDATGGLGGPTRRAVAVVARAYERLLADLQDVRHDHTSP